MRKGGRGESASYSPPSGGLSYVERQIAELILQSYTVREISAKLGLPAWTLSVHLQRMYVGFNVAGDRQCRMVQLALRIHEQRAILGIRCQACWET